MVDVGMDPATAARRGELRLQRLWRLPPGDDLAAARRFLPLQVAEPRLIVLAAPPIGGY